jgi:hypothetical protein
MKLIDIKPLRKKITESTSFKISADADKLLTQIIEGKPLNASHWNLMARLMVLAHSGAQFTVNALSETNPVKADIDCVKCLPPEQLKCLAKCWQNCTHFPPVMFDYTAGAPFGTFLGRAIAGAGSE